RVPAEERAQLGGGERVIDVGGVEQRRRLRPDRLHHRRMAMAQVVHREAREEVEVALAVGVPQLRAAPAHERHRLARVDADLVRGAQRDHLGVGQSVSFAHAPTARLRVRRAVRGRISVPTPREVSTSSSTAWRTRPSITRACTPATSPTRPRSPLFSLRATTSSPSFPERPTALPPWRLSSATISWLIFPTSTISTMSMVAASVTRSPRTKRGSMPAFWSAVSICGPPPCTTTGFMPTYFKRATSCAKESFSSSSSIACPPYLMTSSLPAKRRM